MDVNALRQEIAQFVGFSVPDVKPEIETLAVTPQSGYTRRYIRYQANDRDIVHAYLLVPNGPGPFPGVLIHHQHNKEYYLGKSEVCGITGESTQAFGHPLATKGMVVLAPDTICYEDRRRVGSGTRPEPATDWLQYYNEVTYRLLVGDFLMRKILTDAAVSLSLLMNMPEVDSARVGTLGHFGGGISALFHAALDLRIQFACISGFICSFKQRMISGQEIEMGEIIPGFIKRFDIPDLVKCMAPRKTMLVAAVDEKCSKDTTLTYEQAHTQFSACGQGGNIQIERFLGSLNVNRERFKLIVDWMAQTGARTEV